MFTLYTTVVLITILILIITVTDAMTNRLITYEMKKWTVIACFLIACATLGECIGVLTNGASPSLITLHKIAKLVEFCCAPAIGVAVGRAYGAVKYPRITMIPVLVHALFQCIALPFGWVFRVDAQNIYHRQGLYCIYVIAFILSILCCIICIIRGGQEYQTGVDSVLVLTLIMIAVGIVIQFVCSDIRIDFFCITIGNALLYSRCYKITLQVDPVTRLLNRRCYDMMIGTIDCHAVILFFDINKFKLVNDTYGHSVGDICLKHVADQLRNTYGQYGHCYRIGGDEFCVILNNHLDGVQELNKQFLNAISVIHQMDPRMTDVSLGFAYYNPGISHIQKVIEDADAMMYRNKK